jgi:hypothetical protein
MTAITLPEPAIKTPHSYHEPGRTRHIDYLVRETESGGRIIVRVSAMYFKNHKRFAAVVNRIVIEPRSGPFVAEKYRPLDGFRGLPQKPVSRFSSKAFEAYVADLVEEFPGWVRDIPSLAEKFAEHADSDQD